MCNTKLEKLQEFFDFIEKRDKELWNKYFNQKDETISN